MTNKLILFYLLITIQLSAIGQVKLSKDFLVTVGTPYKVVDAGSKEYFFDGKGFTVSVKTRGETVTIQRFDITSMKEVSRNDYDEFPIAHKVQKVFMAGDKLYYLFSSFNKKEKQEDVYLREVDMSKGTFLPSKLLFSTASEVAVSNSAVEIVSSAETKVAPIRFEIYKSFDDSKLLIRYRLRPAVRNDSKSYDVLGFHVYNAALEKQWGGEVKMPYTEKEMNNIAYGVTKNGNAFMIAFLTESKQLELLNITKDLKVKANKMNINTEFLFQELKLRETADGNLTCLGFYANGLDYKFTSVGFGAGSLSYNTNGILAFKMDPNGKVLETTNLEFPIDLINQYESKREVNKNERRENKGKAGVRDVRLIDITLDKAGNTIVIGEQQYVETTSNSIGGMGGPSSSNRIQYFYCDVIATKFDKSGKVLWMKKLPKTQVGYQGKGGLSIRYIKGNGANYILYLDNVKNADISIDEVPKKHHDKMGGFLTAYKIDDTTGAIEKHSIFDITDIKGVSAYQFRTSRIFDAMDNVFVLEVYLKGKEDTMIKMELAK
jgi:hypothetical protein